MRVPLRVFPGALGVAFHAVRSCSGPAQSGCTCASPAASAGPHRVFGLR